MQHHVLITKRDIVESGSVIYWEQSMQNYPCKAIMLEGEITELEEEYKVDHHYQHVDKHYDLGYKKCPIKIV